MREELGDETYPWQTNNRDLYLCLHLYLHLYLHLDTKGCDKAGSLSKPHCLGM